MTTRHGEVIALMPEDTHSRMLELSEEDRQRALMQSWVEAYNQQADEPMVDPADFSDVSQPERVQDNFSLWLRQQILQRALHEDQIASKGGARHRLLEHAQYQELRIHEYKPVPLHGDFDNVPSFGYVSTVERAYLGIADRVIRRASETPAAQIAQVIPLRRLL